jgi:hypothetical protein
MKRPLVVQFAYQRGNLRDSSYAMRVLIGRNLTRLLSLMSR